MRVHKVVLMIVDHDDLGAEDVVCEIENVTYPNRCTNPRVASIVSIDVDWDDSHPLNKDGWKDVFNRLTGV